MEKNVGDTDGLIRILLGAVSGILSIAVLADLLPSSVPLPEVASPVLGVIALALLATGFTNKCGLYSTLGMSTKE